MDVDTAVPGDGSGWHSLALGMPASVGAVSSEARFSMEDGQPVFVCNVHLVSGSFKEENQNHAIPGYTDEARNKFKHAARMGVMKQTVDKAALAKP